ncbi:hypothetical protein NDU88_008239 [Pleurodeles waltl]|uniref:Retropepsins domain-containing protein n=1 Tax=Pleurodeles waltl TaxID=8319 RepID=A0AAV7QR78_PLEWA|nr:hypothetical protein NDU88_008239 [Pleurodeles waltl]
MPICQVTIDSKEVTVLADSGSPYTLVGDKNWERIFEKLDIQLRKPDINPGGYGGTKIDFIGYTVMRINFKGRETVGKVYVAKRGKNLLGWRHQKDLGIILNPNAIDHVMLVGNVGDGEDVIREFPDVFMDRLV